MRAAALPRRLDRRLDRAWRREGRRHERSVLAALRGRLGTRVVAAGSSGCAAVVDLGDTAYRLAPVHPGAAAAVAAAVAAGPVVLEGAVHSAGVWALQLRGEDGRALPLLAGRLVAAPGGGITRRRAAAPALAR